MKIARSLSSRPARRGLLAARSIGGIVLTALIWLAALACVAPLLIAVADSLVSPFPSRFHRPAILSYLFVLQSDRLWNAFKNTAIQEAIIIVTTLFFCPLAGYAFAKFRFRGKSILFGLMVLTLFFAPITLLIPLLLEMNEIGWLDTYQGLVMPLAISSLGIFWMTMAIRAVPDEVLDAARLDGCGSFATWWRMVLPIVRPGLLALSFFICVTAYDDYMWPLLVLPDDSMQTVQLYLQGGTGGYGGGGGSLPSIVITSIPTIVAFLIMQRYYMPHLFRRNELPLDGAEDDEPFHLATLPSAPPAAHAGTAPPAVAARPRAGSQIAPADEAPWDPVSGGAAWDVPSRGAAWDALAALAGLRPWPAARGGRIAQCALIVGCAILVSLTALTSGFRLDDVYRVVDNPGIEQVLPIWRHFTDPLTSAGIPSLAQYRPLLPLSLSINYALAGNNALGYHLGNLLLDVAAALVVYALARELLAYWATAAAGTARVARDGAHTSPTVERRIARRLPLHRAEFLAMAVALLVAIHPIAGLLVSYVAGRDLLLMQIFLGASLLLYARMRRLRFGQGPATPDEHLPVLLLHRWFGRSLAGWLLALALFELALLAKNQAIVLPALVLAFELTAGRRRIASIAPYARALPFALVAAAHLTYMNDYLHFPALPDAPNIGADAVWSYPLTQLHLSAFHYLAIIAWPFSMRQIPVEPTITSLQDPGVVVGLLCIAGTLVAARLLRRAAPVLAFCMLGYWIAQSPESSLVPMLHNAADYRPYPALPFLFLALALLLERWLRPAAATVVLLALAVFFGIATLSLW